MPLEIMKDSLLCAAQAIKFYDMSSIAHQITQCFTEDFWFLTSNKKYYWDNYIEYYNSLKNIHSKVRKYKDEFDCMKCSKQQVQHCLHYLLKKSLNLFKNFKLAIE